MTSLMGSVKSAHFFLLSCLLIPISPCVFSPVEAFQASHVSHIGSSSATKERRGSSRRYQSSLSSSLNDTDWNPTTDERHKAAVGSQKVHTHPKRLSFFSFVKFVIAGARGELHLYVNRLREKHGDAFIVWNRFVIINDKDAIRDVLETYNLPKSEISLRGWRFFFGEGSLFSAPWEEWKIQRRMISPALMEASIGALQPRLVKGLQPILDVLEQAAESGTAVEMDGIFQAASTDIIGLVIFGKSLVLKPQCVHLIFVSPR